MTFAAGGLDNLTLTLTLRAWADSGKLTQWSVLYLPDLTRTVTAATGAAVGTRFGTFAMTVRTGLLVPDVNVLCHTAGDFLQGNFDGMDNIPARTGVSWSTETEKVIEDTSESTLAAPAKVESAENVLKVDVVENVFLTESVHTCVAELIIALPFFIVR